MKILLTGATGLVGSEVLRRWLAFSDAFIVVPVRAPTALMATHRVRHLLDQLGLGDLLGDVRDRVAPCRVDLACADLDLNPAAYDALADGLDAIVHAAASVNTNQALAPLRVANVESTRHLLTLARRTRAHFHHVSTIGVAGRQVGLIEEEPLAPPSFNNAYEQSKSEAEALVLACPEIATTVWRLSQIFGDSRTGWTPHFRMTYLFARLVVAGRLPFLPLAQDCVADAVTIDYVADALAALTLRPPPGSGTILHIVAGHDAPSARTWTEHMHRRNRARGIALPPLRFVEPQSAPSLLDALRHELGALEPQHLAMLEQVNGLLPHLSLARRIFDDARARALLDPLGIDKRTPYDNEAIDDYCFRSHWGLTPEPRPPLGPRPAGLR